jgi:iron complex transport system ATP-binding protein
MRLAAENLVVMLGRRRAIDGVSLSMQAGEMIGLIGPNGAGKTTLLRALAGLLPAAAGRVLLEDRPIGTIERNARARAIGYLPQSGGVHWALSVAEVVALGRLPRLGRWRAAQAEDHAAVGRAMQALEITALAQRPATRLSGGEQARVLLARALAGEPHILLADEPVSGLDPYHRLETMEHLARLAGEGRAVMVVLHDLALAARFCRRLVLLDRGRIAADGTPAEVLTPARLASIYRIEALRGSHQGIEFILPWNRTR